MLAILFTSLVWSGCASMDSDAEGPAFCGRRFSVPMQQMAKQPDLPFNKAWIKQGVKMGSNTGLFISPL